MNRDTKLNIFLLIGLPVLAMLITFVGMNLFGDLEDAPNASESIEMAQP